nr:peptidase [Terriglobales bacterium]
MVREPLRVATFVWVMALAAAMASTAYGQDAKAPASQDTSTTPAAATPAAQD